MENCQTQTHYRKRCHGIDGMARNLISPFLFFSARGNNFILTRRKGEKILRAILRESTKIRRLKKKERKWIHGLNLQSIRLSLNWQNCRGTFSFFSGRRCFRRFGRFSLSLLEDLGQIEELRSSQMDNAIKMAKMTLGD